MVPLVDQEAMDLEALEALEALEDMREAPALLFLPVAEERAAAEVAAVI